MFRGRACVRVGCSEALFIGRSAVGRARLQWRRAAWGPCLGAPPGGAPLGLWRGLAGRGFRLTVPSHRALCPPQPFLPPFNENRTISGGSKLPLQQKPCTTNPALPPACLTRPAPPRPTLPGPAPRRPPLAGALHLPLHRPGALGVAASKRVLLLPPAGPPCRSCSVLFGGPRPRSCCVRESAGFTSLFFFFSFKESVEAEEQRTWWCSVGHLAAGWAPPFPTDATHIHSFPPSLPTCS